jgi:hypothetical protein
MQHAIAYTAASQQQVYGAKATINVWDPAIQESNGFSLSQLWILSGSFNGSDLNSIEAGWQVRSTIPIPNPNPNPHFHSHAMDPLYFPLRMHDDLSDDSATFFHLIWECSPLHVFLTKRF